MLPAEQALSCSFRVRASGSFDSRRQIRRWQSKHCRGASAPAVRSLPCLENPPGAAARKAVLAWIVRTTMDELKVVLQALRLGDNAVLREAATAFVRPPVGAPRLEPEAHRMVLEVLKQHCSPNQRGLLQESVLAMIARVSSQGVQTAPSAREAREARGAQCGAGSGLRPRSS